MKNGLVIADAGRPKDSKEEIDKEILKKTLEKFNKFQNKDIDG